MWRGGGGDLRYCLGKGLESALMDRPDPSLEHNRRLSPVCDLRRYNPQCPVPIKPEWTLPC